jgi:hypothetical protein
VHDRIHNNNKDTQYALEILGYLVHCYIRMGDTNKASDHSVLMFEMSKRLDIDVNDMNFPVEFISDPKVLMEKCMRYNHRILSVTK